MALRDGRRAGLADFGRFAIGMASIQSSDIGIGQYLVLRKFAVEPINDRLPIAIEHPERQPKRPHVLAAQCFLVAKAERLHGIHRQLGDIEMDHLPLRQAAVFKRIGVIFGLAEIARRKLATVGNDQATGLQVLHICLECRRVHRDEHIGCITRRIDFIRTEIDLEGGNPEQCALRRPDLCGEIRERRKVIPCKSGRKGELATRQLHPITGIAGETHDDRF